jgi:hypothetical protein
MIIISCSLLTFNLVVNTYTKPHFLKFQNDNEPGRGNGNKALPSLILGNAPDTLGSDKVDPPWQNLEPYPSPSVFCYDKISMARREWYIKGGMV